MCAQADVILGRHARGRQLTKGEARLRTKGLRLAPCGAVALTQRNVAYPFSSLGHPFRPEFCLHANRCLGWRWADLVRGRTAHSPVGYSRPGNGWQLQSRSSLSKGRAGCIPRPPRVACRRTSRCQCNGACAGPWPCHALHLEGRGRGQSYGCFLHVAAFRRPVLCYGSRRLCRARGQVLGWSPLRLIRLRACKSGIVCSRRSADATCAFLRHHSDDQHTCDGSGASRRPCRRWLP